MWFKKKVINISDDEKDATITTLMKKNLSLRNIINQINKSLKEKQTEFLELEKKYKDKVAFIKNLKNALKDYLILDEKDETK